MHYVDAGTGPETVLLLHAFPLHAGMWMRQIAALSPRYRVVAPDVPGFGGTPARAGPVSVVTLATEALDLLTALGVARFAVVGLSMGGYVAFEVFRQRPGAVRALALCDTRAGADTAEGAKGRGVFAEKAIEAGLGWVADELLPKLVGPRAEAMVTAEVRRLILEGTPAGVAAAQRAMATRPDSTPTLANIACPTLILVGTEDVLTPPVESQRMAAAIRGAQLVAFPGVGHLSNLEAPTEFNQALGHFLEALPA